MRLAKFVFKRAVWIADFPRERYPERFDEIRKLISLKKGELKAFREIGQSLIIPCDEGRGLVLQSEDFETLAPIDMDEFWTDKTKPFGLFISQERKYRSQCLKQADVLMLMHLFPHEFTGEQKRTTFEYYEPRTCHDSSLSYPIHSIMAARLGLNDKAYEYWKKSAFLDLNAQSRQTADGLHESSLGGNWQAVIFGFAGMAPANTSDELKFSPRLPEAWKRLAFRIHWHCRKYEITIDKSGPQISQIK